MPEDTHELSLHFVEGFWNRERRRFRDGVLIVQLEMRSDDPVPLTTFEDYAIELGATIERYNARMGWMVLQGNWQPDEIQTVARQFKANHEDDVAFVQPDFVMRTAQTSSAGGDIYGEQWGLRVVDMREAWGLHEGRPTVLIAIVDTGMPMKDVGAGVHVYHEDLDHNRFFDGKDIIGAYPVAYAENPHGLFVAGVIAARVDDRESVDGEIGIKGMNLVSPVYPCRAVKESQTSVSLVRQGIEHVMEVPDRINAGEIVLNGFKEISHVVVNLSLYVPDSELPDEFLNGLMDRLDEIPNILLCCSSGTTERDDAGAIVREVRRYPAAFSVNHGASVVAVGGTELDGDKEIIYSNSAIGDHITLVAPAKDIKTTYPMEPLASGSTTTGYSTASGTSLAAPFITAIASLVWSKCPNISAEQVVTCLRASCEDVPASYGATMDAKEWGSGRINAYNAIPDVEVVTTSLAFADVAPGDTIEMSVQLRVKSPIPLTLSAADVVVDGSSSPNTIFRGNTVAIQTSVAPDTYETVNDLTVTYHGTSPGSHGSATVRVRCKEFGEDWVKEVRVTGNTHDANSFVVLCADKSGSMKQPSGVGDKNRKAVLDETVGILIDVAPKGTAIDIVSFDGDAHGGPGTTVLGDPGSNERLTLKEYVKGLAAEGSTSIGDAVEMAQDKLNSEPAYDNQAMIVLTDGKETAGKYISEVDISKDVYAIGIGVPDVVNAESLVALVSGNENGYLLITGALGVDDEFRVAKYLLQILSDVKSVDIASDPTGRLLPDAPLRIPFQLADVDRLAEVVVMMPEHELIGVSLEAPGSNPIDTVPDGVYFPGDNVSYYRFDVSSIGDDSALGGGVWHVVLTMDHDAFERHLAGIKDKAAHRRARAHGALYTAVVNVSSSVRMKVSLSQSGYVPGSTMTLHAALWESGLPVGDKVQVSVDMRQPNRTIATTQLTPAGNGVFEATKTLSVAGVYECSFKARGLTRTGHPFWREHVRTAFIGSGVSLPLSILRGIGRVPT